MSATDRMRELLDERGVDYRVSATGYSIDIGPYTTAYANRSDTTLDVSLRQVTPEQAIAATLGAVITGDTSDGYHTFNELYHHRAVLFSVIVRDHSELAWKSKLHHDGSMYDGMFIVGIETPHGQATYHYDIDPYWDMFECKELDRAPEWDGHTPDESIARIAALGSSNCTNDERTNGTCHMEYCDEWSGDELYPTEAYVCSACGYITEDGKPNYCPNCGRRVEVDE